MDSTGYPCGSSRAARFCLSLGSSVPSREREGKEGVMAEAGHPSLEACRPRTGRMWSVKKPFTGKSYGGLRRPCGGRRSGYPGEKHQSLFRENP